MDKAKELTTKIGRLTMLNEIDTDILEEAAQVGSMELARLASQAIADRNTQIATLQAELRDLHAVCVPQAMSRRLAPARQR